MEKGRVFFVKLLLTTAIFFFIAGGALSLFAYLLGPNGPFRGWSLSWGLIVDPALRMESSFMDAEEARNHLDGRARSYLDRTAVRLGDRYDVAFYQSVVDDGYERLLGARTIASQTAAATAESVVLLTTLEMDADDAGWGDAVTFIRGLRPDDAGWTDGFSENDGGIEKGNETEIVASQTTWAVHGEKNGLLASVSPFFPSDFFSDAQKKGNPLNALRPFDWKRSASDSLTESRPWGVTAAVMMSQRLAPASSWAGSLFSLLSLVISMTRSDGLLSVLLGQTRQVLNSFFHAIRTVLFALIGCLTWLFYRFNQFSPSNRLEWSRSLFDKRLTERKMIVLIL